ncbi:glyoxalase [Nocardia huaxiensis]|uniref:Glyoxalase n=1 Tax=Nocardia huaxiensis TaxID=2755382 RepID=A0A7D6ZTF7_9NOCA|nr:glyoxalase [Nocardia huaxiensis]QLY28229.1 glyoxalase [Nocardia huaxiensis]UFS98336.1 glyoxalase [Nocardia huaxiensis]
MTNTSTATAITVNLETADPTATAAAYDAAFGLGEALTFGPVQAASEGFRGFMMSLVVDQPGTADNLIASALRNGFSVLDPAKKSFWGYGGIIQGPDGTIWKITTSQKKDTGPSSRKVDSVVLLLGVEDVKASKRYYVERGLTVSKSFGGKYAEFDLTGSPVKLALYPRKAAAKDAGVSPAGSGSHGITMHGTIGTFTDPDGFAWQADA